jgi:membrane protease YdiL (CAAX protease family)
MTQALSAPSATLDGVYFRPKLVPILVVIVLGFALPILAALCAVACHDLFGTPGPKDSTISWLFAHHLFQGLLGLMAIFAMRRLVPADYGLHLPRQKTYLAASIGWGILFGVLMTLVDYAPELIQHTTPALDYPLSTGNVSAWMIFEGIVVGPTEEIPFRALLVTYLAATMPGRIRIGRYQMNWAGVIVAAIFALMHANNFSTRPWPLALGQQLYAFALGVLYAYWLEKSKSVLASCVGHNVSDCVEYALLFIWVGLL